MGLPRACNALRTNLGGVLCDRSLALRRGSGRTDWALVDRTFAFLRGSGWVDWVWVGLGIVLGKDFRPLAPLGVTEGSSEWPKGEVSVIFGVVGRAHHGPSTNLGRAGWALVDRTFAFLRGSERSFVGAKDERAGGLGVLRWGYCERGISGFRLGAGATGSGEPGLLGYGERVAEG